MFSERACHFCLKGDGVECRTTRQLSGGIFFPIIAFVFLVLEIEPRPPKYKANCLQRALSTMAS